MARRCCLLALVAACGTEPDTRPETADYVIVAVLEPQCGRGGCHTSDTAPHQLVFDAIPSSLASLRAFGRDGAPMINPGDALGSRLYTVVIDTRRPMPPDSPVANPDVELIRRWIDDGAAGFTP